MSTLAGVGTGTESARGWPPSNRSSSVYSDELQVSKNRSMALSTLTKEADARPGQDATGNDGRGLRLLHATRQLEIEGHGFSVAEGQCIALSLGRKA
jgi:hypothetical protein